MLTLKPSHPKRFGQHFLHDKIYIRRIIEAAEISPNDCLIEIGPGGGALTEPLLSLVNQLIAIEIDPILCDELAKKFTHWGTRLCLHRADALAVNLSDLVPASTSKVRLISNLPYNIATPLLFHWLQEKRIEDFHVMVQKEVADRLTATPGTKAYSRLTVMMQYYCEVYPLFRVKSGAFYPPPKVESAVVRIVPRKNIACGVCDEQWFAKIVKAAFNQRRKIVANSLSLLGITPKLLEGCLIDPKARAETLAVADYVRLTNKFLEGVVKLIRPRGKNIGYE